MKRFIIMIVVTLVFLCCLTGCKEQKAGVNEPQVYTESETEKKAENIIGTVVNKDNIQMEIVGEERFYILGNVMLEGHYKSSNYLVFSKVITPKEDGDTVTWSDGSNTLTLKISDKASDNTNCSIAFNGDAGNISGIQVALNTEDKAYLNTRCYVADITGDLSRDLIVVYNCKSVNDRNYEDAVVYDFKNQKVIEPFADSQGSLSSKQEKAVLEKCSGWVDEGYTELKVANKDTLDELCYGSFEIDVCKYMDGNRIMIMSKALDDNAIPYKCDAHYMLEWNGTEFNVGDVELKVQPRKVLDIS